MNKDIHKYIANCTLCKREMAKMQMYPLQMMDIPDHSFNKIAIDLITDLNVSTSGNQHIHTIIDHLTGWPDAFPMPNKKADTLVHVFINIYLLVHMCSRYILSSNEMEFKNQFTNNVQFHKYLKPTVTILVMPYMTTYMMHCNYLALDEDNTRMQFECSLLQ